MAKQPVYDVVVVGSGAGAAALVGRLVERGLSVCIVERGRDITPPEAPSESVAGLGFAPPLSNTLVDDRDQPSAPFAAEGSALGGGTVVYTGNVLRFQPTDFHRHRTLGDVAGAQVADWPIGYDELAPYYDELEAEMGVAGDAQANPFEPPRRGPFPSPAIAFDRAGRLAADAARRLDWSPFPIPTVASPARGRAPCIRCGLCTGFLCTVNARWSARAGLLAAASSGKLVLELGATVTRVLTTTDGARATGVEYATADGSLHAVEGRTVVLAANAIQTPRILLQSATSQHPDGLANRSGQVGRNLMSHVMESFISIGHVEGEPTITAAGCTLGLQDFYDPHRSGVALPITLEPRTIGAALPFARMVAHDPGWRALDRDTLHERFSHNVAVLSMIEDLAQADNRVRLHATLRDALGLPVPVVTYAPHALDLDAARVGSSRARELLLEAGARDVISVPARTARFHVMGTCRMGQDGTRSVVDRDGRAHDVANLWIADASVFVTSAGVNPSLTVQALARRTADKLIGRLS